MFLLLISFLNQKEGMKQEMEYLDLYDRNKKKTGSKILRKSKIPEGMYQLVVVIFIQNKKESF